MNKLQERGLSKLHPPPLAPLKPQESVDPPLGGKAVAIPYVATDGRIWPQGTRLVWPVACQP